MVVMYVQQTGLGMQECWKLMCVTVPRMAVLEESCGILQAEIEAKRKGLAEKEARLTLQNPPAFGALQVLPCAPIRLLH